MVGKLGELDSVVEQGGSDLQGRTERPARPGRWERRPAFASGRRARGLAALLASLLLGISWAGAAAASVEAPRASASVTRPSDALPLQVAGKVEGHSHNTRRGSSAEVYGGSSADRYGGSSADNGGMGGKVDRRVYAKPKKPTQKDEPKKKPEDGEERQDREDGEKPEDH